MSDFVTPKAPHPLLKVLPDYLKDHANFPKIQKLIIESFAGKHSHGEVVEWAKCPDCQRRFANRHDLLKKLGFSSSAQYMAWVKVHTVIKNRMKLR